MKIICLCLTVVVISNVADSRMYMPGEAIPENGFNQRRLPKEPVNNKPHSKQNTTMSIGNCSYTFSLPSSKMVSCSNLAVENKMSAMEKQVEELEMLVEKLQNKLDSMGGGSEDRYGSSSDDNITYMLIKLMRMVDNKHSGSGGHMPADKLDSLMREINLLKQDVYEIKTDVTENTDLIDDMRNEYEATEATKV